jgi:hypothetical protein
MHIIMLQLSGTAYDSLRIIKDFDTALHTWFIKTRDAITLLQWSLRWTQWDICL